MRGPGPVLVAVLLAACATPAAPQDLEPRLVGEWHSMAPERGLQGPRLEVALDVREWTALWNGLPPTAGEFPAGQVAMARAIAPPGIAVHMPEPERQGSTYHAWYGLEVSDCPIPRNMPPSFHAIAWALPRDATVVPERRIVTYDCEHAGRTPWPAPDWAHLSWAPGNLVESGDCAVVGPLRFVWQGNVTARWPGDGPATLEVTRGHDRESRTGPSPLAVDLPPGFGGDAAIRLRIEAALPQQTRIDVAVEHQSEAAGTPELRPC